MYDILIKYQTGDSFSTEDRETKLGGCWTNPDIVRENLQRIKEHYQWVESVSNLRYQKELPMPAFMKDLNSVAYAKYAIPLLTDDRQVWQISTFWSGYFETLYSAEVCLSGTEDSGLCITF